MPTVDFPASPTLNDTYTVNGRTWRYNGTGWVVVAGALSILDADVSASAGIVYSKLNLTGSIVDADISASAAIAGSKISPSFTAGVTTTSGALSSSMGTKSIEIGQGSSNTDGSSFIDLRADSTYTDFGCRLERQQGANGASLLIHRGAGDLAFGTQDSAALTLGTANIVRLRCFSAGTVGINSGTEGTPGVNNSTGGFSQTGGSGSTFISTTNASNALFVNIGSGGGNLIDFRIIGGNQGQIRWDGANVLYEAFAGSHWGRLADNSTPDIPIGTIVESIDQLIDWKLVYFQDTDGQALTKAWIGPEQDGATVEFEHNGQTYSGQVGREPGDELVGLNKHTCVKVSDVAGSKAVFGVFSGWSTDENSMQVDSWPDMSVVSLGNFFVRMDAGEAPQIGDYVESAGNGCARVQSDDILRASTVAKVTSTIPQRVYDDGSFLVTVTLHCG